MCLFSDETDFYQVCPAIATFAISGKLYLTVTWSERFLVRSLTHNYTQVCSICVTLFRQIHVITIAHQILQLSLAFYWHQRFLSPGAYLGVIVIDHPGSYMRPLHPPVYKQTTLAAPWVFDDNPEPDSCSAGCTEPACIVQAEYSARHWWINTTTRSIHQF